MKSGRVLVLAVLALALGSAVASADSNESVISACVDRGSALIRSLEPGDECRKHERPISWNERGPQGERGPAGPPGLSGVELVRGDERTLPTGVLRPSVVVNASCPDGKVALWGGATVDMDGGFVVLGSPVVPDGADAPTGWRSFVTMASGGTLPSSASITATAFVTCASVD